MRTSIVAAEGEGAGRQAGKDGRTRCIGLVVGTAGARGEVGLVGVGLSHPKRWIAKRRCMKFRRLLVGFLRRWSRIYWILVVNRDC